MKKLALIYIFIGLFSNVSGQEEPKNLKEILQADWIVGSWETKNADGQISSHTFSWKIEDVLMVKEFTMNGELQSFATISLDVDEDKIISHSYGNRRHSTGEIKVNGNKFLRTVNWNRKKLSDKQIESRAESYAANQLASGAVKKDGVEEAKQKAINYMRMQKESGTRKWTYEKQGEDKLVMTRFDMNESGQFVKAEPVTYTRKNE